MTVEPDDRSHTPGTGRFDRIALVLNARAAADDALRRACEAIGAACWPSSVEDDAFSPEKLRDEVQRLAREADLIVSCGGDGTLNQVVNALLADGDTPLPALTVLPYGTGNDFAHGLGIAAEVPAELLHEAPAWPAHTIDIARVEDRYFVNAVTGAPTPQAASTAADMLKQLLGRFAYPLRTAAHLFADKGFAMQATGDGFEWSGRALGLAVANGWQVGGGFRVAPEAKLDDALLDINILPELPVDVLARVSRQVMAEGAESAREHSVHGKARSLTVAADAPVSLSVDGEACGPLRGFRFEVVARALEILAPGPLPEEPRA